MLHIDGDIIAYRIACALGDEGEAASVPYTMNSFIGGQILAHFPELTPYKVYLSGDTNFRDDVAVTAPYKGNRDPAAKPVLLPAARQHLIDVYDAVVSEGIEADDAIATAAYQSKLRGEAPIICSIDKDFDQIEVPRYDFVQKKYTNYGPLQAVRNLYKQVLTGDTVDNIKGCEGVGPVAASELIDGFSCPRDMTAVCVDQMGIERFCENMNLVRLLRSADEWDGSKLITVGLVEHYLGDLL